MKEYECPAISDNLRLVLALAAEELIAQETETPLRQRLFVVLEELYNNTALHAYEKLGQPGPVRIRLVADQEAIHLRLEDQGEPFNLLEYDDTHRVTNIENLEEGGEGIFLIKTLSQKVDYARVDGWNRIDIIIGGTL